MIGSAGDAGHVAAAAAVVEKAVDGVRQVAVAGVDRRRCVGRRSDRAVAGQIAERLGELRPVGQEHCCLRGGWHGEVDQLGRRRIDRRRIALGDEMDLVRHDPDEARSAGADTGDGLDRRGHLLDVNARRQILRHADRSFRYGNWMS
jgi:hypothetical protein